MNPARASGAEKSLKQPPRVPSSPLVRSSFARFRLHDRLALLESFRTHRTARHAIGIETRHAVVVCSPLRCAVGPSAARRRGLCRVRRGRPGTALWPGNILPLPFQPGLAGIALRIGNRGVAGIHLRSRSLCGFGNRITEMHLTLVVRPAIDFSTGCSIGRQQDLNPNTVQQSPLRFIPVPPSITSAFWCQTTNPCVSEA